MRLQTSGGQTRDVGVRTLMQPTRAKFILAALAYRLGV